MQNILSVKHTHIKEREKVYNPIGGRKKSASWRATTCNAFLTFSTCPAYSVHPPSLPLPTFIPLLSPLSFLTSLLSSIRFALLPLFSLPCSFLFSLSFILFAHNLSFHSCIFICVASSFMFLLCYPFLLFLVFLFHFLSFSLFLSFHHTATNTQNWIAKVP